MKKIENLHPSGEMFVDKINEIVDAVNEMYECFENGVLFEATPEPEKDDLEARGGEGFKTVRKEPCPHNWEMVPDGYVCAKCGEGKPEKSVCLVHKHVNGKCYFCWKKKKHYEKDIPIYTGLYQEKDIT